MPEINHHLPENVRQFCSLFPPSARLCRFVNRRSGTLLDIRPNLDVVNDEVPQVVGNPESAGVQYARIFIHSTLQTSLTTVQWIITPYGNGQAIIPVPKDGSMKVRYLTPSTAWHEISVTVSPFPTSWVIMPSSDCPHDSPLTAYTVPQGVYEQWTCLISWPNFTRNEARMLDLWAGEATPNKPVVIYPFEYRKQWQYWLIQFIRYNPKEYAPLPVLPSDIAWCPPYAAVAKLSEEDSEAA